MACLEWFIIGGIGLWIHHSRKKAAEEFRKEEEERRIRERQLQKEREAREEEERRIREKQLQEEREAREAEWQAKVEEERRRNTPCYFNDGISSERFEQLIIFAVKKIKNRKIVWARRGAVVCFEIDSLSGSSTWNFTLDFNDYGHITGRYWRWQANHKSTVPERIGNTIQETILGLLAYMP